MSRSSIRTHHGAGKMTVSRSEMAMDMRTRLVGERMCFLLNTMMIRMLERNVMAWNEEVELLHRHIFTCLYLMFGL